MADKVDTYGAPYALQYKKENAHDNNVWCVAWGRGKYGQADNEEDKISPTDYIVTGGLDDLVKVWEISNERIELRHKFEGHSLGVVSVAISSDGKICASSSLDSSLKLWSLETGELLRSLEVGPVEVWTVAFSPDDKYVISGSNSGIISFYDVETGKTEKTLDSKGKFTLSIAYSPDGKYIASGSVEGIISIFDVATGKHMHMLGDHAMPVRGLCFSPDSQLLLTASDDGHMKLYDINSLKTSVAGTLSGHSSWVINVAFSRSGNYFTSSSSDKTVKVWSLAEKQCVHTFHEHQEGVWGVAYSPDSDKIVSVSDDKSINIYKCPKSDFSH